MAQPPAPYTPHSGTIASVGSHSIVPANYTEILVEVDGRDVPVHVPPHLKGITRQRFQRLARDAKYRASVAGNKASTAFAVGGGLGGAIASGGVVAIATGSGAVGLAGIIVTGFGLILTTMGIGVGHYASNVKAFAERQADKFRDTVEELK